MKAEFNTLTGALVVDTQKERPVSFLPYATDGAKTLVIYPESDADFGAALLSSSGTVLVAPLESAILASEFFFNRGIPTSALSLSVCDEVFDIPSLAFDYAESAAFAVECQQIYTNTINLSGGMPHTVYTECGKIKTRIIEAPSEVDFSPEILRRIKVAKGLPDAARSIAYREIDGCYKIASSDSSLTLDSVKAMLSLAHRRGKSGKITVICRGISFEFEIPQPWCGKAYLSYRCFFSSIT